MYNDRDTLMKVLDLIMELDLQESMILIGSWDELRYFPINTTLQYFQTI